MGSANLGMIPVGDDDSATVSTGVVSAIASPGSMTYEMVSRRVVVDLLGCCAVRVVGGVKQSYLRRMPEAIHFYFRINSMNAENSNTHPPPALGSLLLADRGGGEGRMSAGHRPYLCP